RQDILDLWI
nr:Chain B, ARG-GLN-ASP-ILE-LEU-ASP-LEU-TRP-ILE [Human immunodeficiency virus]